MRLDSPAPGIRPCYAAPSRGFTLLEVMIAITIGIAMSGIAASAFFQMRQVAKRNQIMTDLAQEAAYIYRRMEQDLAMSLPSAQFRIERLRGATSDRNALRVFFHGELPDNVADHALTWPHWERWQDYTPYKGSGICLGWEWTPPSVNSLSTVGTLKMGSTPFAPESRKITWTIAGTAYSFWSMPSHRRSALRSTDDNDLRLYPGAPSGIAGAGLSANQSLLTGDYTELFGEDRNNDGILDAVENVIKNGSAAGSQRLDNGSITPVSLRVKSLDFAWIPFNSTTGDHISITAANGVSGSGADEAVFGGLYRDGRLEWPEGATWPLNTTVPTSVLSNRPSLLSVLLVLMDPASRIERSFTFTFPLGGEIAQEAGL